MATLASVIACVVLLHLPTNPPISRGCLVGGWRLLLWGFFPTQVRESLASTMAILADIKTGDIVIDPMVGGGSLLLQAIELRGVRCFAIGSDLHKTPARLAKGNLASGTAGRVGCTTAAADVGPASHSRSPFDVMFADVRTISVLREASVDVCISDLPFGKRCLERAQLPRLYAQLLAHLARVLVPATGRAVLMTGALHLLLGPLSTSTLWEPVAESDKSFVRHGPGSGWCSVVVLRRSGVAFKQSSRAARSLEDAPRASGREAMQHASKAEAGQPHRKFAEVTNRCPVCDVDVAIGDEIHPVRIDRVTARSNTGEAGESATTTAERIAAAPTPTTTTTPTTAATFVDGEEGAAVGEALVDDEDGEGPNDDVVESYTAALPTDVYNKTRWLWAHVACAVTLCDGVPERPTCPHFDRRGKCAFGDGCFFAHPMPALVLDEAVAEVAQ